VLGSEARQRHQRANGLLIAEQEGTLGLHTATVAHLRCDAIYQCGIWEYWDVKCVKRALSNYCRTPKKRAGRAVGALNRTVIRVNYIDYNPHPNPTVPRPVVIIQ
jgi:hypothetical protein